MPQVIPAIREGNVLRPRDPLPARLMTRLGSAGYVCHTEDDLFAPDLAPALGINVFSGTRQVAANFAGMHYHAQLPTVRYGVARNVDCGGCLWADVEPARGLYRWSSLDAFVAAAAAAGRDIVYCFLATPAWASARPTEPGQYGAGSDAEPADLAALGSFAAAVSARFLQRGTPIHAFEVWNEPKYDNGGGVAEGNYFTGTPSALAAMARTIWNAVKAADPAAIVLSPSPTGLEFPWFAGDRSGTDNLYRFLIASDGAGGSGAQWFDAVAFHAYSHTGTNNLYAVPQMLTNVRACLAVARIGEREAWITETSAIAPTLASFVSQHQQEYVARTLLLALGAGASRVVWYAWDDPLGFSDRPEVAAFWNTIVGLLAGRSITLVNSLADRRVAAVVDGARLIY